MNGLRWTFVLAIIFTLGVPEVHAQYLDEIFIGKNFDLRWTINHPDPHFNHPDLKCSGQKVQITLTGAQEEYVLSGVMRIQMGSPWCAMELDDETKSRYPRKNKKITIKYRKVLRSLPVAKLFIDGKLYREGKLTRDPPPRLSAVTESPKPSAPAEVAEPTPSIPADASPVLKECAQSAMNKYYDCGCVDGMGSETRDAIVHSSENQSMIQHRQQVIDRQMAQLEKESDPKKREILERAIDKGRQTIVELQNPMSIPANNVIMSMDRIHECKTPDVFREEQRQSCLKLGSSSIEGDPEAYCSCAGSKAAEHWMQTKDRMSSNFTVSAGAQARLACNNAANASTKPSAPNNSESNNSAATNNAKTQPTSEGQATQADSSDEPSATAGSVIKDTSEKIKRGFKKLFKRKKEE